MARINLNSGESPQIHIEDVAGSLQIKSWDGEGIRIEANHEEDLKYSFNDNVLVLSSTGDCILRCPEDSEIEVNSVSGNAFIGNIESELAIDNVSGSLTLKNVGASTVGSVSGNLAARNVEGDLSVQSVSGNLTARNVEGDFEAHEVSANLSLREIEGSVMARSSGNADLRLAPEEEVDVEASGNIFCFVDEDTDAEIILESDAEHIQVYTKTGRQLLKVDKHQFTLGEGGHEIQLKASGHIDFRSRSKADDLTFDLDLDFSDDMTGLADEISDQITSQMESQLGSLNDQLESLSERLRNTGDRAARTAQRHVLAAQRRLQHKLESRQGKRGRVIHVGGPAKTAEPVTAAERALILQMVQEKKVTVAEAEMLLNALEGRAGMPMAPEAPEAPVAATLPDAPTPPTPPERK